MRNSLHIIIVAWLVLVAGVVNAVSVEAINRSRQLGSMAFKKADYPHAVDFFRRYMDEVKGDKQKLTDAYECLISAYIRNGDIKLAKQTLDDFTQRFPGVSLLRKKIFHADILLLEKKYPQAAKHYEAILETSIVEGELYFQLLSGLAFAQAKQGKWSRAVETYAMLEQVGKNSGWQLKSRQLKIEALIMDGQLKAAASLLKKVAAKDHSIATTRLKLLLLIKQKKYAEFLRYYNNSIKKENLQPNAPLYNLCSTAAKYFLIANDIAGATKLLNDAWYFAPTEFDRKKNMRTLINAYVRGGEKANAVEVAKKYIEFYKATPDVIEVRFQLARLLHEMKKNDDAELVYRNMMSDKNVSLKLRLAAAKELSALLASDKRYDLAQQALDFVYQNGISDADKYEGRFLTGKLYMRQAKYKAAALIFQDTAQQSKRWHEQAACQQIECLLKMEKYSEALKLAETALNTGKDSAVLKDIAYDRALLMERLGRLKDARTAYLDFAKKYPGNKNAPAALYSAAEIAYNGKKFVMAAELFADFARKYKDNRQAPLALYKRLYANYFGGMADEALKDVDHLVSNYPKGKYTIAALFWEVDWFREHHKFSQARMVLKLIQKKYQNDPQVSAQALYEFAVIDSVDGKLDHALENLKIIFNKYSTANVAAAAYLLAGDTLSRDGKYLQAIEYYSRGARLRPDSPLEITCRGRIGDCNFVIFNKTADKKYLAHAITEYLALKKLQALTPAMRGQTMFKLGRAYELQGQIEKALSCYSEVILGYQLDKQKTSELSPLWAVKAAYAAILMYLKEGSPESAGKAIRIYKILQDMKIKTGENFTKLIKTTKDKYKL